jgi:hypothetical protein
VRLPAALAAGLLAFVALFPFSGDDSDPQRFHSVFGYRVPVGDIWLALAAGVIAGAVVWMLLRARDGR